MEYKTYFIIKKDDPLEKKDFNELVREILPEKGLKHLDDSSLGNTITIGGGKDDVDLYETKLEFTPDENKIVLRLHPEDKYTLHHVRTAASEKMYKVFSVNLGAFLPHNTKIKEIISLSKIKGKIFSDLGYTPIYTFDERYHYAVSKKDNKVHIINNYLLYYLHFWPFDTEKDSRQLEEFSYPVANTKEEFTTFFDLQLIPVLFYEYYKKPVKIINDSMFDINNPGKKVFVKPLIYKLDSKWNEFHRFGTERGSSILMDKIRKGENLDQTLKRVIKYLEIGDDYVRAHVLPNIDFDRDRDGIITPRLIVHVYMEKTSDLPKEMNRGWTPVEPKKIQRE